MRAVLIAVLFLSSVTAAAGWCPAFVSRLFKSPEQSQRSREAFVDAYINNLFTQKPSATTEYDFQVHPADLTEQIKQNIRPYLRSNFLGHLQLKPGDEKNMRYYLGESNQGLDHGIYLVVEKVGFSHTSITALSLTGEFLVKEVTLSDGRKLKLNNAVLPEAKDTSIYGKTTDHLNDNHRDLKRNSENAVFFIGLSSSTLVVLGTGLLMIKFEPYLPIVWGQTNSLIILLSAFVSSQVLIGPTTFHVFFKPKILKSEKEVLNSRAKILQNMYMRALSAKTLAEALPPPRILDDTAEGARSAAP